MPYEKIIKDTESGKFLKDFNSNDPTKSDWNTEEYAFIYTDEQEFDDTVAALEVAYQSTDRFIGQNPPPR